jgi:outer membrane protein OmpA-like peptidoglycan-associated protein/uncharacterized protein YidB (DUF937 family)
MAIFDALIDDVASRFGLGANAGPLIREVLAGVTGSPGGVNGFLNTLKSSGLAPEVASWLGHSDAAGLTGQQIERALGSTMLGGMASRLGLGSGIVSTAAGYALPKLIGLLTPGGVVPTTLPAEVTNFLSAASAAAVRRVAAPTAQVAPSRIDVYHSPPVHDEPALTGWLWPLLGALAILGLGLLFWPGNRTVAPPVAQAPVVTPAPPPVTLPAHLALANDNGVIHVSGSVHDEDTKTSILNALKAVFGADKVQGDLGIDLNRGAAPWLVNFRNAVEAVKTAGVRAVFDGNSVNVGGSISDAQRDGIINSLRSVLGSGLIFGPLAEKASMEKDAVDKAATAALDKVAAPPDTAAADKAVADKVSDLVAGANSKAATELATLKSGFAGKDLIAALNDSVVNFASGSAEVPAAMTAFLQSAAGDLKQLPSGSVVEIAGYTDNTGDSLSNVALSQKRADAVRDALIKGGANPDMLVAKGYGGADPIASNDTPEGRFRNRRIEYQITKSP